MKQLRLFSQILSLVLIFSGQAFAHDECNKILAGNFQIIPSGRNDESMPELKKAAEEIFGKNGIAAKLGISLPPHMLEFAPSSELSVLATLGRHAVGHWHDGAMIATQSSGAAGVLEFVTPGCPTCRSFYSDNTSMHHQISVLMHVAGHNDFSSHSIYNSMRPSDPIADSLELYELMEKLYLEHDHDEVSQWYQYLLSMDELQDLARGTFESPESLAPPSQDNILKRVIHAGTDNPYPNSNHPRAPTASTLQAFVANLPVGTPQWKIDMAKLFERIYRIYGYYVSTKIMNEGWATLMQEFLAEYYSGTTSEYSINHATLQGGVAYESLQNPYWLGRECWRNLRKRFNKKPENASLDKLERDRKFIKYAHGLIDQYNDYDFIREALDEQWVYDHGLFLKRPAQGNEWDQNLPLDRQDLKQPTQFIVETTEARRIVNYIAKKLADHTQKIPRVLTKNFNYKSLGVILLEQDLDQEIPLEKFSAAQTLYILSRIMQKPVALNTKTLVTELRPVEHDPNLMGGGFPRPPFQWWGPPQPIKVHTMRDIQIEVNSIGEVKVSFKGTPEEQESLEPARRQLSEQLQVAVNSYRVDDMATINEDLVRHQILTLAPSIAQKVTDHAVESSIGLLSHSPTAGKALLEYYNLVEKRMDGALEKLKQNGLTANTGNSIRIQVLPQIPKFRLDNRAYQMYKQSMGQNMKQTYPAMKGPLSISTPRADDDLDLGSGGKGRRPGDKDRFWDEGSKQGNGDGDGEGDGDGDPQDGDADGDQPGKGQKPGKGGGSPYEVDVPLELYGELLGQELELPRLRPKAGQMENMDMAREGGESRPVGNVLWERMMPKVLVYGENAFRKRGINPKTVDKARIAREGWKYIQPTDYIVSSSDPVVIPEYNAVIVIWLDMTGSMNGEPLKRAKELTKNLEAMLKTKYKKLEFRYVGFSDYAKEFPVNKFFRADMGGGTNYASGIKLSREILETYSPGQWDRYSFGIGDAQDGPVEESLQEYEKLVEQTEYSAFVHTDIGGGETFMDGVRKMVQQGKYIDWARVDETQASSMAAIRKLFGKNKQED